MSSCWRPQPPQWHAASRAPAGVQLGACSSCCGCSCPPQQQLHPHCRRAPGRPLQQPAWPSSAKAGEQTAAAAAESIQWLMQQSSSAAAASIHNADAHVHASARAHLQLLQLRCSSQLRRCRAADTRRRRFCRRAVTRPARQWSAAASTTPRLYACARRLAAASVLLRAACRRHVRVVRRSSPRCACCRAVAACSNSSGA